MNSQQTPTDVPNVRRRGVVAIVLRDERFLVIRRSASVPAPGKYCFAGGGIEAGESEAEALVREFQEELGATIVPVRRVWQSTTRWQVELAWWLGTVSGDVFLIPNAAEVESFHWLTADEMLAHEELLESNRHFLHAMASGELVLLE